MNLKIWDPKKKPAPEEVADLVGKVVLCSCRTDRTVTQIKAVHFQGEVVMAEVDAKRLQWVQVWPLQSKPPCWVLTSVGRRGDD